MKPSVMKVTMRRRPGSHGARRRDRSATLPPMPADPLLTAAKVVFVLGLVFGFAAFDGALDPAVVTPVLLGIGALSGILAAVRADLPRATTAVLLPLYGFAASYLFC
jgi:hypothetical protein